MDSASPICVGSRWRLRDSRIAGPALWSHALTGGARATGRRAGSLAPGFRADLVVLDPEHPSLVGRGGELALDSMVFAPGTPVRDVMVGGAWCLRDGHHTAEARIARAYRSVMARLVA